MNPNDLILVARIGKSIGLKGDLKLHIQSDFLKQFQKGKSYLLQDGKELIISNYNPSSSKIRFLGYEDIDLANTLVNQSLYSTVEETSKNCILKDKEYFYFDIIGSKIIEDELVLGVVKNIDRFGDSDYLLIQTDENLIQKDYPTRFCIPYIDHYILDVDKDEKIIHTHHSFEILKNS